MKRRLFSLYVLALAALAAAAAGAYGSLASGSPRMGPTSRLADKRSMVTTTAIKTPT